MEKYGFHYNALPDAQCRLIPHTLRTRLITTGETRDRAKNHCCAVSVTNALLLLISIGRISFSSLPASAQELFDTVHRFIKNGPVLFIAAFVRITRLIRHCGIGERLKAVRRKDAIIRASDSGHPVMLLLMRHPLDWHWVVCVGHRDGSLLIADSWHHTLTQYTVNRGSLLVGGIEFDADT